MGRRNEDTRTAILQSAARLFGRLGYSGASVRAIVEEAGVSKPMLYYYFPDKRTLMEELLRSAFRRLASMVRERVRDASDLREALISAAEAHFAFYEEDPDRARMLYRVLLGSPDAVIGMLRRLSVEHVRLVEEVVCSFRKCSGKAGLTENETAIVFLSMINFQFVRRIAGGGSRTRLRVDRIVDIVLQGVPS